MLGIHALSWWVGIFPPEWYRYKRIPKAEPRISLALAVLVILWSIAIFVALAIIGSHDTSTQSEVSAYDKSGTDGWSCDMVSKVTDKYALNDSLGTSYTLVNIIENHSTCLNSLSSLDVDPCSKLAFTASDYPSYTGSGNILLMDYSTYDILYFGNALLSDSLFRYVPILGAVETEITDTSIVAVSVAYSKGIYWTLGEIGSESVLKSYQPESGAVQMVSFNDGCKAAAVAIDGNSMAWVARICYTNYVNVYTVKGMNVSLNQEVASGYSPLESAHLSITPSGDLYLGVFRGSSKTVSGALFYKFNEAKNGTFELLFSMSMSYKSCNMAVDPTSGFIWLLVDTVGIVVYDHDGNEMGAFDPREPTSVDLGSENSVELSELALSSSLLVDADHMAYFSSGGVLYRFGPLTTDSETLLADMKSFSGTSAWFVCGQQTQNNVPSTTESLLSACALNGVKWQVDLEGKDFFSFSEMNNFAISGTGASTCNVAADKVPICNVVADLPPYICTRSLPAVPVTYIGSAAGTAHLVYAILVILISAILTVSTCPPPASWYGTEIPMDRVNSDDTQNKELLLDPSGHRDDAILQAEIDHFRDKMNAMEVLLSEQRKLISSQQSALSDLQLQVNSLRLNTEDDESA